MEDLMLLGNQQTNLCEMYLLRYIGIPEVLLNYSTGLISICETPYDKLSGVEYLINIFISWAEEHISMNAYFRKSNSEYTPGTRKPDY